MNTHYKAAQCKDCSVGFQTCWGLKYHKKRSKKNYLVTIHTDRYNNTNVPESAKLHQNINTPTAYIC